MGFSDTARDILATIVGLALIAGSSWLLYKGMVPWQATAGASAVGLYLALPRRMRIVGDVMVETAKRAKSFFSKSSD